MKPKLFLRVAGIVLIALGSLGLAGILESFSDASFFHPPYWINWVHLLLGVIVLIVSFINSDRLHSIGTLFPAIIGTTIGVGGLLFGAYLAEQYGMPELADPSDHLAHLTVGFLAIWAWKNRYQPTKLD